MTTEIAAYCRDAMAAGSKSFTAAARLFPSRTRLAARLLYSWCRYCDDEIDGAKNPEDASARLMALSHKTRSSLRGIPQSEVMFKALQSVCTTYRIPEHYPLELLKGMQMDVDQHAFRTTADLHLYCYRVASVVGLMMTHVMGINDRRALKHAADAGTAMQMTNIARDVLEDHRLGRVYLPESWFAAEGLKPLRPHEPFAPERAWPIVQRLLRTATHSYNSGRKGLRYLPLSAAFAIAAALEIYEDIGRLIQHRGPKAWSNRAIISGPRKLWLIIKSTRHVLALLPARITCPWKRIKITRIASPRRFPKIPEDN